MKKIFVVTHTHWDRMWYFTEARGKFLLDYHFKEYLKILEEQKLKNFVLDGQTLILKDLIEGRPEAINKIKLLVKEDKLIVGPSWYQNDQVLVRGESIVRNLSLGIKFAKDIVGRHSNVMYVPDTFGHSHQIPQIINGFGLDKYVAYRGWDNDFISKKDEFLWIGPNNSSAMVKMLPHSYGFAKSLPTNVEETKERFEKVVKSLDELGNGKFIVFPNGNDQAPMPNNLEESLKTLQKAYPSRKVLNSSWDDVMNEIEKNKKNLEKFKGELLYGKFSRVHRSFYSSRIDIKILNSDIEKKLIDIIEPLSVISKKLRLSSYKNRVKYLWESLLTLQGHDALVSANSDITNNQVFYKLKLISEECDDLIEQMKLIIGNMVKKNNGEDILLLYNLSPSVKLKEHIVEFYFEDKNFKLETLDNESIEFDVLDIKEVNPSELDNELEMIPVEKLSKKGDLVKRQKFYKIKIAFKHEIIGLGFDGVRILKDNIQNKNIKDVEKNSNNIEDDFWKITIEDNEIKFSNKETKEEINNAISFESSSDEGDEFNYSPSNKEWNITDEHKITSSSSYNGKFLKKIIINYVVKLPADLKEREIRKTSIKNTISLIISLMNNGNITIKIKYKNIAKDHRARIIFNTNILANKSFALSQFGEIERPIIDPAFKHWKQNDYAEAPIPVFPFTGYVKISEASKIYTVVSNTAREYEILNEKSSKIALTLFRSVGWMGKSSLNLRPGRPSGVVIETPCSQMMNKLIEHDFLITNNNENLFNEFKIENIKNQFFQVKEHNWFPLNPPEKYIYPKLNVVTLEENNQIEVIKLSVDNKNIIFRGTIFSEKNNLPKNLIPIRLDEKEKFSYKKERNVIFTYKMGIND